MKNKIIKQTAVFNGKTFEHFGIKPHIASMYGKKPEDIINVELTVANDQTIPPPPQEDPNVNDADYWGWYDFKRIDFTMVYAKRFLLEMCFPAGLEESEKFREGKAYRVNVVEAKK